MKLAIVIVNYNVKYYLKQCLQSVFHADRKISENEDIEVEVWVVDNDSVDGSADMIRQDFPNVHLIENHENVGFARANNQALAQIEGADLVLLLNPDTVIPCDTLTECVRFMQHHPDCGGLGVKMVDGKGRYHKESKRGFPTPEAAFFKISGLIHLFPHSKRIAAYYMGHLDPNAVHSIDILCGAFLMFRQEVYKKIGGLDEDYFMYGEDIDYSWRIRSAGYQNYYLPTTRIIHYKGESTRKGSMNYVYSFYHAMSIFVSKYYSGGRAKAFSLLLHLAIWLRATLAWVQRIVSHIVVPAFDFTLAYAGFLLLKSLWIHFNHYPADYYPTIYTTLLIPLYILILMTICWLRGGYDRPVRIGRIASGIGIGFLLLLAFYSLLDETQRYSRMLLLLGSAWTLLSTIFIRLLLNCFHIKGYSLHTRGHGHTLIIGSTEETSRVQALLTSLGTPTSHIETTSDTTLSHLQDLIRIHHADEVIFCGHDINTHSIIRLLASLPSKGIRYMIAPEESDYLIGNENVISPESLYLEEFYSITTDPYRRFKRTFDLFTAALALLLSPILFWVQHRKSNYFAHCFGVISGNLSWVGYMGRCGVFTPADRYPSINPDQHSKLTLRYMHHYSVGYDIVILLRNWNNL